MSYVDLPHLRICDQLVGCVEEPWQGVSPRVLTAGYALGILKTQGEKNASEFVQLHACDLSEAVSGKGPFVYDGAPCLLPLKRR